MNSKYFNFLIPVAIVIILLLLPEFVDAQCPMCRIAAESNMENGGSAGKGLNKGILYLLATPYLIVGTLGFLWWRSQRNKNKEEREIT